MQKILNKTSDKRGQKSQMNGTVGSEDKRTRDGDGRQFFLRKETVEGGVRCRGWKRAAHTCSRGSSRRGLLMIMSPQRRPDRSQ